MRTPPLRYRAVFASDFHLGAAGCKADAIQSFLESVECEYLYLMGDIVDLWVSGKASRWRQKHTNVLRVVLSKSENGCKVFYTPGNHDALLRKMNGAALGNIVFEHSFAHYAADGKKLLVVHGDLYDKSVTSLKPLAWAAAWGYELLTLFANWRDSLRPNAPQSAKGGAGRVKQKFKRLIQRLTSFEERIVADAKSKGYDGVVCGHIHKPKMELRENGVVYINVGDWVEHSTAVVEHWDGSLELIDWETLSKEIETHDLSLLNESLATIPSR